MSEEMEGNLPEDGHTRMEVIIRGPEVKLDIIRALEAKEDTIRALEAKQDIIRALEAKEDIIRALEDKEDIILALEAREDIIRAPEAKEDIIPTLGAREDIIRGLEAKEVKDIILELQVDLDPQLGDTIPEDGLQLINQAEAGATRQQLDQTTVQQVDPDTVVMINLVSGVQDLLSLNSFSECQQTLLRR